MAEIVKKAVLLITLLIVVLLAKSQDNVARLTNIIGSHIEFNFNSIDKIRNGISIPNGTTLGVTMEDLTGGTMTGWHIDFESYLAQGTIDDGPNSIPLNVIEVTASNALGLGTAQTVYSPSQFLSTVSQTLVTSTVFPANGNTHQINLSYDCGVTNSVMGHPGGYYTVDIEILLIPDF